MSMIQLEIKRQLGPREEAFWESFEVAWEPELNVISVLMKILENPVNARGDRSLPVSWDSGCLEEVCGACSMVINGKPRQACSALIDSLDQPIRIEPLSKFPVVRDLVVDRQQIFEGLKKVQAWNPMESTEETGEGPLWEPELQQEIYAHSRCMSCGLCLQACPIYGGEHNFIGPAAVSQAYRFNNTPIGKDLEQVRLDVLTEPGGVSECDDDQSCAKVCPKGVPLLDALKDLKKDGMWAWF